MRFLAASLALALSLGGCTLGTPLMEPMHRWERPFAVSEGVRGVVILTEYMRPEIGVRVYERTYRYERYDPQSGGWFEAALGPDGYGYTPGGLIARARARGEPLPGEAGAMATPAPAPAPAPAPPADAPTDPAALEAAALLSATIAAEGGAAAGTLHPPMPVPGS